MIHTTPYQRAAVSITAANEHPGDVTRWTCLWEWCDKYGAVIEFLFITSPVFVGAPLAALVHVLWHS